MALKIGTTWGRGTDSAGALETVELVWSLKILVDSSDLGEKSPPCWLTLESQWPEKTASDEVWQALALHLQPGDPGAL